MSAGRLAIRTLGLGIGLALGFCWTSAGEPIEPEVCGMEASSEAGRFAVGETVAYDLPCDSEGLAVDG